MATAIYPIGASNAWTHMNLANAPGALNLKIKMKLPVLIVMQKAIQIILEAVLTLHLLKKMLTRTRSSMQPLKEPRQKKLYRQSTPMLKPLKDLSFNQQ